MFEWRDHTAEIELHIAAATPEDVFREAAVAFAQLVDGESAPSAAEAAHSVELTAQDHASLLVQWVEELVYLADAERFVPLEVTSLELEETGLKAELRGVTGSPRPLLKAVTYHDLEFARGDDSWYARLVLDV